MYVDVAVAYGDVAVASVNSMPCLMVVVIIVELQNLFELYC